MIGPYTKSYTAKLKSAEKKKLNKVVKRVNAIIPYKNKWYFGSAASVLPDITGAVGYTTLCNPSQGDTVLNRTGDRIRLHSLKWNVSLNLANTQNANNGLNTVRMIILYDHENSFSNMTQLLNGSTNVIASDFAASERPRWTLVCDKLFPWPPSTNLATGFGPSQMHYGRVNLKDKLATFTAGGTAVYHGQLKVFFATNQAAAAGIVATTFYSECFFSDVL